MQLLEASSGLSKNLWLLSQLYRKYLKEFFILKKKINPSSKARRINKPHYLSKEEEEENLTIKSVKLQINTELSIITLNINSLNPLIEKSMNKCQNEDNENTKNWMKYIKI